MCSRSHLFSGHRHHAAALLHSDWLVLGPRAERSGTQAAEQVESQDRRGQGSPQGQTGVRPAHNRPPSELTRPANQLAPAQSPRRHDLTLTLKGRPWALRRLQVQPDAVDLCVDQLSFHKPKRGGNPLKDHSISTRTTNHWEGRQSGYMSSCLGRKSQRGKSSGVHDVSVEKILFPSCLKYLSRPEYCSHDISNLGNLVPHGRNVPLIRNLERAPRLCLVWMLHREKRKIQPSKFQVRVDSSHPPVRLSGGPQGPCGSTDRTVRADKSSPPPLFAASESCFYSACVTEGG